MLIQINDGFVLLRFNNRFYSINAIIAANTQFSEEFSSEVTFAMLNIGKSLYHLVKLTPKRSLNLTKVYAYANEALTYPS